VNRQQETESASAILGYVCHLHHERARCLLHSLGIYRGQPPVLFHLAREDGLSHSELCSRLRLQPATVTKMITRMERRGLVTRRPDPSDQRISRVYLTEEGRRADEQARRALEQLREEMLTGLDDDEKDQLRVLLIRVRDNLLEVAGKR